MERRESIPSYGEVRCPSFLIFNVGRKMRAHHMLLSLALFVAGCAHVDSGEQSPLDRPIHGYGVTEEDLFLTFSRTQSQLPEMDRVVFEDAFWCLVSEFRWRAGDGLLEEDRNSALRAALEGLTPRQIILVGTVVFFERIQPPDKDTEALEGQDREDYLERRRSGIDGVKSALGDYGRGRANKRPDGTSAKAPPSNPSQGAAVPHP